ncbi:MAG TPA: SDR family NAD(P)-dependent oxidoreductase [Candidatus Saccharimonadales bacterium]|jgi:NAD(P)-dependent dehydrogenase (short-subunit alcohol dehydrogenase family)|nr:SDR family NAD(P)-dependent oxidoreductase [Candidatus Saccharimonadales bacterium]
MSLSGRRALVTGGTRGIGLAIARALRAQGAAVVAVSNAEDQIAQVRKDFAADEGLTVEFADVRDRASLEAVRERVGELDILVPNAGINTRCKALDLGDAQLRDMIETNVYGVFVTCQVFGPLLFDRDCSRVVVTSSAVAIHGMDLRAAYTATKAGLTGLVRSLAVEWGPHGVNVNAVGPGIIRTPLTQAYIDQYPERATATVENTPLRRLGTPEDVADVVTFLASDEARFVTGQTVYVDGGITAGSAWW